MKRHCLVSLSAGTLLCAALSFGSVSAFAQAPPPAEAAQPAPLLSANQLDDLVAPIALYPDPLLSQILVASTYPLELVQASQWMQRNRNLTGEGLTKAAEQQNWDPSVQGLVIYPDVVNRLNQDITWTTNLGNAFLNQESDVMDAVQRMRGSAQTSGKLSSTPQQSVTTAGASGQPIIQIMPSDPQVIYVPAYDPSAIWGPSSYYPYPNWYYPSYFSGGPYFSFGLGIPVGAYFGGLGGGWGGWGSYGWLPGWGGHSVIVNNGFFSRYNFNLRGGPVRYGSTPWIHNGYHRLGVPYSSSALYSRYGANARPGFASRLNYGNGRSFGGRAVQPFAGAGRAGGYRQVNPQRFQSNYRGGNNFVASPNRGGSNFIGGRASSGAAPIRSSPGAIRSGGFAGGGFRSSGGGGFRGGGGARSGGGGGARSGGGGGGRGGGGHR